MTTTLLPLRGAGTASSTGESIHNLHAAEWLDGRIRYDCRHWSCEELDFEWLSEEHLFVVTEQGRTAETRIALDCGVGYSGRDRPGSVSFIPANFARKAAYRNADLVFSAFWIDPIVMEELSGARTDKLKPLVNGDNEVIRVLIGSIGREIARGCIPDTAYVEHLAAVCFLQSCRQSIPGNRQVRVRTLSRRRMAEIEAFIDAHLGARISVSDLATLSGMTADYFTRAFKATTGEPPYAFITGRRVEQARQLIAESDHSLSHIAFVCGFASQSHLTSVFRSHLGVTPKALRVSLG